VVEQAVLDGEYLAVAEVKSSRALLYRFKDEKGWQLAEEWPLPETPYRLMIPAPGVIAATTPAGVRVGHETRNAPGAVRSAVAHVSDIVVAGDFDHVHVLPPNAEHYQLAEAKPGSILAVSSTLLAVGGVNGVSLLQLASAERLTSLGRGISYASIALLLAALGMASFGFICDMLQSRLLSWKTATATGAGLRSTLGEVSPDMVGMCLSGTGVLWTGAGLSAQAGFPVRSALLKLLIQMGASDDSLARAQQQKLTSMAGRGAVELAINELAAVSDRMYLAANLRAVYSRYAMPSRAHELLAQLPFAAAVTTNYDTVLDRFGDDWVKNPVALDTQRSLHAAELPFLLKLYGDLADNHQVLLSHAEFMEKAKTGAFSATFRVVFGTRSLLFVGSSLEGLLADLHALGLAGITARKHYALAGVSNAGWKKQVAELKERFGVEVLACTAETIATALPEFLEDLVQKVQEQQNARPHVIETTAAAESA